MATNAAAVQHLTFFERVEGELKKLFKKAPGWEASAAATLTYVAPLVELLIDPALTPGAALLVQKIQSAMAAAAVVVKDAGPTPTLATYLRAITNDLAQIEAAAGVKDEATAEHLHTVVVEITAEVNAILAIVGK